MDANPNPEQHLFAAANAVVKRIYPICDAEKVTIHMSNGKKLTLPVYVVLVDQRRQDARHSPDFRSVQWFGTSYTFTPGQAAVVKILWEAWENGTPEVGGDYLVENAGLQSSRLSDLFRGHPAWDKMLVQGGERGVYRLAEA